MCPAGRFSNDTQTGVRSNFTRQCEHCPVGLVSGNYHFKDKKKRVGSTECECYSSKLAQKNTNEEKKSKHYNNIKMGEMPGLL
jgi:hypothetical protein